MWKFFKNFLRQMEQHRDMPTKESEQSKRIASLP